MLLYALDPSDWLQYQSKFQHTSRYKL